MKLHKIKTSNKHVYHTLPSEYPKMEFKMKSGGAIESTNATISGFKLAHKLIIVSLNSNDEAPSVK